jgi:trk system potassium uptake protein TrkA
MYLINILHHTLTKNQRSTKKKLYIVPIIFSRYMHIVLFGEDPSILELAKQLSQDRHNVQLIASTVPSDLEELYDITILSWEQASHRFFRPNNPENVELLIAGHENDAQNLLICQIAAHMDISTTLCISNNGYGRFHQTLFANTPNHQSHTCILSNKTIAKHIQSLLALPGCLDFIHLHTKCIDIACVEIPTDSPLIGQSIQSLLQQAGIPHKACNLWNSPTWKTISLHHTIAVGNILLFILSTPSQLQQLQQVFHCYHQPSIFIVGANNLVKQTIKRLQHAHIKTVDNHSSALLDLASSYPHVTILKGNMNDFDLFVSEGIGDAHAFLALSDDDEDNLVSALLAKKHGARHVFALAKRPELISIIESSSIDAGIAPGDLLMEAVYPFCHRKEIHTAHKLAYHMGYIIDMDITNDIANKASFWTWIQKEAYILYVIRNDTVLFVQDPSKLLAEDTVALWTKTLSTMYSSW